MSNSTPQFTVGQAVQIVDTFNGFTRVVCTGNVERLTKTQVVVRNQHGNESRFRVADAKMVGYSWPHLTSELRPMPTAPLWTVAFDGTRGYLVNDAEYNWTDKRTDSAFTRAEAQAAADYIHWFVDGKATFSWGGEALEACATAPAYAGK